MSDPVDSGIRKRSPTEAWRGERRRQVGPFLAFEDLREAIEEGEIDRGDATYAVELARMSELDGEDCGALVAGVLAASVARRRGSVRLDLRSGNLEGLARRLEALLPSIFGDDERARSVAERLRALVEESEAPAIVGRAGAYRPLIVEDGQLYRHADLIEESRLAGAIADRIDGAWRGDQWPATAAFERGELADALKTVVGGFEPAPTTEQQYAVATAATSALSVITGGPGTGKTSLVVSLLRVLVALGVEPEDVALAAPTGKAADRLGAAIDTRLEVEENRLTSTLDRRIATRLEEPATIHRLLGYSQRRREFTHDAYRPLPHDYVVVDEASMIDLELMDRLVAAVDESSRLVLVGDADQLPAVGSGAVFRDLVPAAVHTDTPRRAVVVDGELSTQSSDEPVAAQSMRLTTNFRMREDDPEGSNVLTVAQAVRDGGEDLEFEPEVSLERGSERPVVTRRASFDAVEFRGAELLDEPLTEWLGEWYDGPMAEDVLGGRSWEEPFVFVAGQPSDRALERLDGLFRSFEQYQLLGVTRRRDRGVATLDATLHQQHVETQGLSRRGEFAVGEPVMMTKNDYERELFNGDRGIVLRVRDGASAATSKRAVFPRRSGYMAFGLGPLRAHLDRAWSMTVHKSQGSEYDAVGIVLPGESIPLSTRELLYTGITRARRSVAFFGSPEIVRDAARRGDERNTGLVERLRDNL